MKLFWRAGWVFTKGFGWKENGCGILEVTSIEYSFGNFGFVEETTWVLLM